MKTSLLPRANVLSATVVRLGIVSFFADISSEMLYPITPIFLTGVLGASMLSVGLIEGAAEATSSLLKTYAGTWSDRIQKRRPFIILGYFLAAVAKPFIGAAHSWTTVLFARGMDRAGKGIRTAPRDALLSDSVDPALQGEAFGWHRLMDTLGAAIGPLFAILFLSFSPNELRPLYFWALIPGMIAVAIAFSVREHAGEPEKPKGKAPLRLRWSDTSPSFKRYLFSWSLFALANSSDVFLILKAKATGLSLIATILMYCFYNLVYAAFSPYLGRLSDSIPRRILLAVGLLIFAGVYIGFSMSTHAWQFWLLFGVYGLYMAATDGVGKALIVDLVPPAFKATGIGIFATVSGLATIIASVVAGFLWDHLGPQATFYYGAVGALISAVCLVSLRER